MSVIPKCHPNHWEERTKFSSSREKPILVEAMRFPILTMTKWNHTIFKTCVSGYSNNICRESNLDNRITLVRTYPDIALKSMQHTIAMEYILDSWFAYEGSEDRSCGNRVVSSHQHAYLLTSFGSPTFPRSRFPSAIWNHSKVIVSLAVHAAGILNGPFTIT